MVLIYHGLRKVITAKEVLKYRNQMNLADSPEWYRIVWILHQRNYKKASDETIVRLLDRYYENSGKRFAVPDCESLVRICSISWVLI